MKKIIKYLRYFITGIIACLLLCGAFVGCSVKDKAYTISVDGKDMVETGVADTDSEENLRDAESAEPDEQNIYVYVCGAVKEPGVVKLAPGSRVFDALQAAGGFTEDAQEDFVNLAAHVSDEEQVFFPSKEEAAALLLKQQEMQSGIVNINTADATVLMTLPGIGENKAQDIISYREQHGEFVRLEDLKKVPGIKENLYAKICDKIKIQ